MKKVIAAAQKRYGDKTTNQHHEQACFIAGADFILTLYKELKT